MRRPCRADLKTSSSPVRTEAGHRISLRGEIQALRSREAVEGEHLLALRKTHPLACQYNTSSGWRYPGVPWAQENCPQPLREKYGIALQTRVAATARGNAGGRPA